jgi:uncharacterized protein YndB with AHSA1/START domain
VIGSKGVQVSKSFEGVLETSQPPEEVWTYLTDSAKFGLWRSGVMSDKPKLTMGATLRSVLNPAKVLYEEVLDFEAPNRISFRVADAPIPHAGMSALKVLSLWPASIQAVVTYELTPLWGGTRLQLSAHTSLVAGLFGLINAALVLRPQFYKRLHKEFESLRSVLAAKGSVP